MSTNWVPIRLPTQIEITDGINNASIASGVIPSGTMGLVTYVANPSNINLSGISVNVGNIGISGIVQTSGIITNFPTNQSISGAVQILGTPNVNIIQPVTIQGAVALSGTTNITTSGVVLVNQGSPVVIGSGWPITYDRPIIDPYTEIQYSGFSGSVNSLFPIISGTINQTIRVFRLIATSNVQTNLILNQAQANGAASTISLPASGSIILDLSPAPWYTTPISSGFVIQSLAANTILQATVYYQKS